VVRNVEKETEFSDHVTTYTKPLSNHDSDSGVATERLLTKSRQDSVVSHDSTSTEKMNEDIDIALADVSVIFSVHCLEFSIRFLCRPTLCYFYCIIHLIGVV